MVVLAKLCWSVQEQRIDVSIVCSSRAAFQIKETVHLHEEDEDKSKTSRSRPPEAPVNLVKGSHRRDSLSPQARQQAKEIGQLQLLPLGLSAEVPNMYLHARQLCAWNL